MPTAEQGYGIATGGRSSTSWAACGWGTIPSSSAWSTRNCQAHDVKNLFVADGGPFVSQADKNPTWTILALSMRTTDYIAAQRGRGDAVTDLSRREHARLRCCAVALGRRCRRLRGPKTIRKAAQRATPYSPTFFTAAE